MIIVENGNGGEDVVDARDGCDKAEVDKDKKVELLSKAETLLDINSEVVSNLVLDEPNFF
ncbi:4872_t:CDS:2 [Dentiscutata erythropus]|uniref:4872_t:CDS:1 n=1 Tax=Dentiscutata erythropus TaxID=1348616 RepID=A0A9N9FEM5_9GLOM|nr:4872_t:CDS:2 [Dentiscutata erythropus]